MDGDVGEMLRSVMSDPAQMEKLTQLAQGLMGGAPAPAAPPEPQPAQRPFSDGETKLLTALGQALGGQPGSSRSTALLQAMRPYMKPEKQEKLDRAMKLTQLVRVAQTVLGQMGGGHGL